MLSLLTVGVLAVAGAQEVSTAKPLTSPRQAPAPFQRLFAVDPITVPGAVLAEGRPAEPRRSARTEAFHPQRDLMQRGPCNMPIMVGDASVDRGILISVGQHRHAFSIRVVGPEACGEKKK